MLEKEKIFFIDEFGIQIHSRVSYGRAVKNIRANKKKAQIRGRNYSVAAAMNVNSLYLFTLQDRPFNADHFIDYIISLIDHLNNDGIRGAHLVMDNVRFHHNRDLIELIRNHGHYAVHLPPYSPFLNPVEELFNQWKHLIKVGQPTNEDELYALVHTSSDEINAEHCRRYVDHMESYLADCLQRNEILN